MDHNQSKSAHLFTTIPTKDFPVKKKSTGNFPITFSPYWICQAETKIQLSNPITNDVFEYELIGIGEEPVAEDNLIIECQARKTVKREIEIKNTTDKALVYRVETDLVYATGPTTLTVPPNKKAIYPI